MFCILVFIIFLLLFPIFGIFSSSYRRMFKQAWECAFKKITLKPCDIDFGAELKGMALGKIAFKYPRLTAFFDNTATFWALLFVVLNIWSLGYVLNSGLNLWVYDTCSPVSGESCSLSGEACGIKPESPPSFFNTVSMIPNRLKTWNPEEYISETATYYSFDESNSTALEIIDPGCKYCKKLWGNIKDGEIEQEYNLTYLVYPIASDDGYKFQHSYLIASYLEALKIENTPVNGNSEIPPDWQLLDKIFTDNSEEDATDVQNAINLLYTREEVVLLVHDYLKSFGYSESQIVSIDQLVESQNVKDSLESQRNIVEDEVKTLKIPTFMYNGKRHDRVISFE